MMTKTILDRKTVSISKETLEELKKLGKYGDSIDAIINRLIKEHYYYNKK